MMKGISEYGVANLIADLPDITDFAAADCTWHSDLDIFICAAGFEERSLAVPEKLRQRKCKAKNGIVVNYGTNIQENQDRKKELLAVLSEVCGNVIELEFRSDATLSFVEALDAAIRPDPGRTQKVIFDVSTAGSHIIATVFAKLLRMNLELSVLYAEAAEYYPSREEYQKEPAKWRDDHEDAIGFGVEHVFQNVVYQGQRLDQVPTSLVIFANFQRARSQALIHYVDEALLDDPSERIWWIVGVPHLPKDAWRADAEREINGTGVGSQVKNVSTFDYKATIRALYEIYEQVWANSNIVIGPFGSKLQTIGMSIFCEVFPHVQVTHVLPKKFRSRGYSVGCRAVWEVRFGSSLQARSLMRKVGTLSVYSHS